MENTLGVFVGRLNPPHIGHLSIIDKALKENKKVILLIGVNGVKDERSPLGFEEIKEILNIKYGLEKNLLILELKDNSSDLVWINEINNILEKYGEGLKKINFYGGDFKTDSAYIVVKEYENELKGYKINYIDVMRNNSFVEYSGKNYQVSATNLRKALREGNVELASMFCDKNMFPIIQKFFLHSGF